MKISVYNLDGNISSELEFPKQLEMHWNPDLVNQAFETLRANRHNAWAHTKGRGEVSGGGIKPWRQKGTGRARHGSIRSPLWKGGGTTFGPRSERIFSKKINKKMLRSALLSALTKKAAEGELRVVSDWRIDSGKAKDLAQQIRKIIDRRSAVLLLPAGNRKLYLSARNLAGVTAAPFSNVNIYDVLTHQYIVIAKTELEKMSGQNKK